MATLCKKYGCLLIIDGSFCSSIFQNPLDLGADIVVHSGTKYFGGHSDTLIGFACMNSDDLYQEVKTFRENMGSSVTEDVCKRTLLSLQTYKIRCLK